jgi:2-polyprenyl-6-methoxyphenol hydroxylase-like FAD-dependent oxidoreductase
VVFGELRHATAREARGGESVIETPVLIAGGGPVGLMLARVLARLGTPAMVVEKSPTPTRHPKMDITNARSMELFRRFGLEDRLRAVAVPEANPFDVAWVTTLAGHELHRFRYMSPEAWRAHIRVHDDGSQPQVPPMRVSQVVIEPVLRAAVAEEPLIRTRYGVALEDLEQDGEGVTAVVRDDADGKTRCIRARYLVGCDGGSSRVRDCLGIPLEGTPAVMQRYMVHFRSQARHLLQRFGVTWHYQSAMGTLIAQDDHDTWTLQTRPDPGMAVGELDPHERLTAFAGAGFDYQVLVANPWTPHLLVAQRYAHGRVLLAGDAAHQYIPTGGYGMNTGIADAVDIGWKLAAVLQGFGGPALVASYDAERRPVGVRNREASGRHTGVRMAVAEVYRELLAGGGGADQVRRAEAGRRIAALGNAENESFGIELGYCYRGSPIVVQEPGVKAPEDPVHYSPTTVPGVRLPSVFLADGSQLYDRLGPWFTLLSLGSAPPAKWREAARRRGVPLATLALDEARLRHLFGADLILVRPDHHIAWRGEASAQAEPILARALGWESAA